MLTLRTRALLVGRARLRPSLWLACPMPSHGVGAVPGVAHHATAADGQAARMAVDAPQDPGSAASHHHYMGLALQQARLADEAGEVPVGAVLVAATGEVLAARHNRVHGTHDPLAHAEMLCIQAATRQLQAWRLLDATLYVTVEPCPMCAGAILQSRIKRLVYGARQPRVGADGSWVALFPPPAAEQGGQGATCGTAGPPPEGSTPPQWQAEQAGLLAGSRQAYVPHPYHPGIEVVRGVRGYACGAAMQAFFRRRRLERAGADAAAAAAEDPGRLWHGDAGPEGVPGGSVTCWP